MFECLSPSHLQIYKMLVLVFVLDLLIGPCLFAELIQYTFNSSTLCVFLITVQIGVQILFEKNVRLNYTFNCNIVFRVGFKLMK